MGPRSSRRGRGRYRTLGLVLSALPAIAFVLAASPAFAIGQSDAPGVAQKAVGDVDRESDTVKQAIANARATERTAEQRIADADILIKSRDYGRAIVALNEVVEKYPNNTTAYPDALSMLGEAYYQSRQLLSARREFREIVQKSSESRMAPYVPQAYQRLVDIALRTQDTKDLDALLVQMGAATGDPTLSYAKAKATLAKRDFAGSRANALGVPATHPLYHQAKYMLGVLAMREAQSQAPAVTVAPGEKTPAAPPTRYAAAIESFRQVTQLTPDTPEHRKVIDLAWLAIGRLFYEADQWLEAVDAYNHVDRQSTEFGTSLYELAWVYVRLGDSDRAARALEILSIADPNNAYLADGTLLRADLMLRSGQFDKALTVYQSIRAEYDPMRERVDQFLGSTTDPAVYYDKLASEQLDNLDNSSQLPALAVQWAREEQDGPAAFAVLDDVQQCRELIRQSQQLVGKLRVILTAPNRIRAFPELRAGDERALQLLNRISLARATIGQGLDDAEPSEVSGELAQVRSERRELQKRILMMPVTDGDLAEREASAQRQWNKVSQHLQQLQLEVDQLQAIVNGLKRMITEGTTGTSRDPATVAQWKAELDQNERDLRGYRDALLTTRKQIDFGKVQVGYGDQRFIDEEQVRAQYRQKLGQELQLVAGGAAGGGAQAYAGRVTPILAAASTSEDRLLAMRRDIDAEVAKKVGEVIAIVDTEAGKIAGYAGKLEVYDQEARLVVGQVAMRNFGLVRDKLRGIVLRADVGAVEEAWEVREEQMARVRNLQVERVREEQILQEELREVLDDSVDPTPAPGSTTPSPLGASKMQAGPRLSVLSRRRLRALVSFGLVASLVLGVALDASSQPAAKPKAGQGAAKKPDPKKDPKKKPANAASASASAAPPPPPPPVDTSAPTATVPTMTARKAAPPPPPPTDEQLKNLDQLSKEVKEYEKDARDFREAITTVVKHHYEMRRRNVLSGLDREIKIEQAELKRARNEAIARTEEFVARYSGPNAHPEHTPNAMFRLAALYEERAGTEAPPEEQAAQLKPAIALYKRIIREFPKYAEMAAIYYYLGHALTNSGRVPESQQVWRSLVCHNKFPYPVATDPADPDKDLIQKKPQDHDPKYWDAWSSMHPDPIGVAAKNAGKNGRRAAAPVKARPKKGKEATKAGETEPIDANDETAYRPIYTEDCQPIPQKTDAGKEPKYYAEIWWQIGDFHFEQGDTQAGPYNYNRAVTAYRLAMKAVQDKLKNQVYVVSMYKLAWTYFKQQRYESAVRQFVDLLRHTEEMEKATGDAALDVRKEAFDYMAGSLTYVDFAGPAEDEPYIIRSDVLDTETNPSIAESKMRIGIDRVQDGKLIPQDRKWTIEVYKSLSREYRELAQLANTTIVLELILQKWPMHRDAPLVQDELAATYDERARNAKSPEDQARFSAKALEARTALAQYVGQTPWVDANRDDPEAIQTAEKLVKGGLRQAAVQHTQNAMAALQEGASSTDNGTRATAFERALGEYKLAEQGWFGYLKQDENATDSYESRFWLADSRTRQVDLMVALARPVPPALYVSARAAAADVRDSNEDDRFLEPAAQFIVQIADDALTEQYNLFQTTNGSQGFARVDNVRTSGTGTDTKVDATPPPAQILAAVQARDEYGVRVPPPLDPKGNLPLYKFAAAQWFYLYGQWDEAEKRLTDIYTTDCKKTKYSLMAWDDLLAIASIQADQTGDSSKARALAEKEKDPANSCRAVDSPAGSGNDAKIVAILQGGFYIDAAKAFKEAGAMPDGPERVKAWRKAGGLYDEALKAAPDRKEAPEAAINGAFAYKQVGDYDKAIAMYRLFIEKYGDEAILKKLEKGDANEHKDYADRVKYLSQAYTALGDSYVLFFNYRAAAETYDKISSIDRFDGAQRKEAARNALSLYSSMDDKEKMQAARTRYLSFKPSSEDKAEADFLVAKADLGRWDPNSDSDSNRAARNKAVGTMSKFFDDHRRDAASQKYNVIAAYWVAKAKQQQNQNADDWWKNTITSFNGYKSVAPQKDGKNEALLSEQGDMAAEADFTMVDADIHRNFDTETGHHKYKGTAIEVTKKYREDEKDAVKYHDKLKHIADVGTYGSLQYVTAALARQGSLYDSLRTALFNTREPALTLFSAQEEKLLKQLEESGNEQAMDAAAARRDKRTQDWRASRDSSLTTADNIMVQRYVGAVTVARKYNVRSPAVTKALQRLAFFTDILGDDKIRQYSTSVEGFSYTDGMFQKTRPGMVAQPDVGVLTAPLPVVPQ